METVLIIFMVLASIIGIISMVIVALTVAKELKQNKAAAANCDNCDKIVNCDSCDKVPNCEECDKVVNCNECDKIPDCDNCEKIPNCDECDKVVNCDECDKIPDCDNCDKIVNCDSCEKIPNCDECDKVVNCDECEYKKAAMASAESKEEVAYTQVQPAEEESVMPAVATEEAQPELSEGTVAFSATKETIDERYLALPNDYKNYYDEIVKHAASIEKSKRYKNARYEEYKVGKNSLVRMLIKRGLVVCEFVIPNFDFRNYVNDNKVAIKQAPITLKVIDESKLQIAKDTIDIAVKAIEEEKEYKKEQARQRRRERAKQVAATEE